MKVTVEDLKDSLKRGYEAFYDSRQESEHIADLYHNRQYTSEQIAVLDNRGQPKETFNIVKLFARMLVGYYSTIVNTVKVEPTQMSDVDIASLIHDTVNYEFKRNRFDLLGDQIKLNGLLSGLLCSYVNVRDTGKRDKFNRPVYVIDMDTVPDYELILDPASTRDDYSDARFLHRWRWFTEDAIIKGFGKDKLGKLTEFYNYTDVDKADYEATHDPFYSGQFRTENSYLVVHTVMEDEDGKRWSVLWHDDVILQKDEITYKECRWPYRVQRLHTSDKTEYYGIFRDVYESQHAINQAIIKIQQMINTQKVFIEDGAVDNVEDFTRLVNRVGAVIPVLQLSKIKLENMAKEVQDQYIIVDKAFDRIQRILGINDSFLGMAYASDSGRKVKLQQSATIMSLRYITARIESFYSSLGRDMASLIKQYYTSNQVLRIADEVVGQRWIELNKPMEEFSGKFDQRGQPIMQPILVEQLDPASGEPIEDDSGNIVLAPVSTPESDISYAEVDITVEAAAFNDEDERNQLLMETMMSGNMGQMMANVNPAGFFKIASFIARTTKTRYSPEISRVFEETANMLSQSPEASQQAQAMASGMPQGQQAMSQDLKLPTNTNEAV